MVHFDFLQTDLKQQDFEARFKIRLQIMPFDDKLITVHFYTLDISKLVFKKTKNIRDYYFNKGLYIVIFVYLNASWTC